jgi:hypothetical protein
MSNPAHYWLRVKAANAQHDYAERGYLEEREAYFRAVRELAKLPTEVVAAAEAEISGQLGLFGEVA